MLIFIGYQKVLKISYGLKENPYLDNCYNTVFTSLLEQVINQELSLKKFKSFSYVHGLLKYPKWSKDSDIFSFIKKEHLEKIQDKKSFFIFDASTEGFSPIFDFPFFDVLYFNCEKYNIDPSMVIYVSSNLKDEKNIKDYCNHYNKKPINVFSFISFEKVVRVPTEIEIEEKHCKEQYQGKYFSSLSRVIRHYRSIATFLLCQDPVKEKALISHSAFSKNVNLESWRLTHGLTDYTEKNIKRWFKSLPLVVDKENFEVNWALENDYYPIHRQTLFQIVNETLVDNYKNTSLFYSEKTFRPMVCFQPFVIYGQKNANQHLKEIGYKTYEDWFDLSFDSEDDNILRYKKLLASIKDSCRYLDSLPRDEQIEWRFKNREVLNHNYRNMCLSEYSRQKLISFLENFNDSVN